MSTIGCDTGTYTGNGTEVVVATCRRPRFIEIMNAAESGGVEAIAWKSEQMPDDDFHVFANNGIEVGDGITITDTGFTVGANAFVNTDTWAYTWTVWW